MALRVPDPSLVVLCGPAASGKTTFARRHFRETAIVSSDQCRAMIADDEADMSASQAAFELFHDIIDARLRRRRLTVADSTALQPDARAALRQIARRWKVPTIAILFSLPEEACLKWDQDRPRRVGPPVIHRQWERFQHARQAVPDEGFDQVVILEADDLDRVQVELETDKALKTELH